MSELSNLSPGYRSDVIKAMNDIMSGLFQWQFAWRLARHEIRRRYRRTVLGPFWATLSMGIFVFSLGFVFSFVWHMEVSEFIPYITTGYIAWMPISGIIGGSTGTLVACGSVITQTPRPYTLFILTGVMRQSIIFFHHMAVFVLVAIFFPVEINFFILLIFHGLLLLLFNAIWVSLLVSMACARFRDLQPLVANVLMICLWLTPVFWPASRIIGREGAFLLDFNIFYHFVSLIRSPLLGNVPDLINYLVVGGISIVGPIVTILLFGRYRRWIIYWL